MKRKLLAALVASLFAAASAFAQGSSVTIYGTLNADFENIEAEGADGAGSDLDSRNRVQSNSSNIGFRGTEDLGNGLKAIFQIESSINLDTGGGNLGGRNSNVGLTGPWGTAFYGNWDTPYKSIGSRLDSWYSTGIGSHIGLFGNTGGRAKAGQASPTGPNNTNPDSFDRRQNNSVQYWTPNFNGLAARLAYSANEEKVDTAAGELDPSLWSGAVTYLNGPLYIAFAYERHEDYGGVDLEDDGIVAGIGYTFGNTTVNLIAERLDYELAGGSDADRDAYHVGALHKIGAITLRGSFTIADDVDGFDESGATMVTAGASYSFSKRTDVYFVFSQISNDDNATYDFFSPTGTFNTNNVAAPATAGRDPRGFGLGIRHSY
ncbi:MAG: porin [Burkholderiales bacterium]